MARAVAAESAATLGWPQRMSDWLADHPNALVLVAVPLIPMTLLGYGTDVDTWNVRVSAAAIRAGHYTISRPPGAPVHEASTAVLDWLGGSVATNLASVVAAVMCVLLLASVLRRAGALHAELAALAVAANPFFIVSATSLADSLWALAFLLGGIEAAQRRRPWFAGVLWALAVGCRMSTLLLVAAYVAGDLIVRRRVTHAILVAGGVAVVGGAVLYVPAWLSVGRSSQFLDNTFGSPSFTGLFGRWALKQALFFGLPAVVVLVAGWRTLHEALRHWRTRTMVAFAVLGAAVQEVLFFRLPWKFVHLLPVLVCAVILYALAPRARPGWFVALAATQLVWGFIAVRTVVPDVRDRATTARVDLRIVGGPLLTDVRCRIDDRGGAPPRNADEQYQHAVELYRCAGEWAYGSNVDVPVPP